MDTPPPPPRFASGLAPHRLFPYASSSAAHHLRILQAEYTSVVKTLVLLENVDYLVGMDVRLSLVVEQHLFVPSISFVQINGDEIPLVAHWIFMMGL